MSPTPCKPTEPRLRLAAFTMVYNEAELLPLWIAHYAAHCGIENLFCIDHGSDDGSTTGLPIQVTRLARGPLDTIQRSFVVSNFHAALLRDYDAVIFTDTDEFIVLDPARPETLAAYLARRTRVVMRCTGLDIIQNLDEEAALDVGRPVLAQRRFAKFAEHYCKVAIADRPVRWGPGFHSCSEFSAVDTNLLLFHLKYADIGHFRRTYARRRGIERSAADHRAGYGHQWRLSLEHSLDLIYMSGSPEARGGTIPPGGFDAHIAAFADRVTHSRAVPDHAELPYVILPERFASTIGGLQRSAASLRIP